MGSLEVADIFRNYGPAWRSTNKGRISLDQLKVMSAIERCRSSELGGHVLHCTDCGEIQIAYNSCRNRHCPKCQSTAAKRWLEARQADLLPVEYFHVVFTLPEPLQQLAYYNKAVMYKLLFQCASQTLSTIAKDPKHLGADIGCTLVLHTWGSALTHHPHIHGIVPGGGLRDGNWIACKKGFFLPVRVLSSLFRRLYLNSLKLAYQKGELNFFGSNTILYKPNVFENWVNALRQKEWVVYSKRPFAGPEAVLEYLSRYTHRVAISNSRLLSIQDHQVNFKWKNYRKKGKDRYGVMSLHVDEFIRRFLLHILPSGFHRIRHYGFLANTVRRSRLASVRESLDAQITDKHCTNESTEKTEAVFVCRNCGHDLLIVDILNPATAPRAPP